MNWRNIRKSENFIWISIGAILIFTIPTLLIDESNFSKFSSNNSRYIYSAIFQGFAAILAITITAVMVTLQGLGSHIQNLENRIFRIIGKSVKGIHPIKLIDYKYYIDIQFKNDLENNIDLKNYPLKKLAIKNLVRELKGYERYIDELIEHEKILKGHFIPALVIIIIILIYSLTALLTFVPDESYLATQEIKRILYFGYFFTIYGIISLAYFFIIILQTWQIRFKQGRLF